MSGARSRTRVINPSIAFLGFLGGDDPGCGSKGEPLDISLVVAGTGDDVRGWGEEGLAGVDGAVVVGGGVVAAETEVVVDEEDDEDEYEYDLPVLVDHAKPADELDVTKE